MSKKLTLGCDPEVFLIHFGKTVIPACGLIGGTKHEPKDIGNGVGVQEDNVTVEFNIRPVDFEPGGNALAIATQTAFEHVRAYVNSIDKSYDLHITSSHKFKAEDLKSEAAQLFGCDPDLDAYSMGDANPTFTAEQVGNMRMAGGHIHIGIPSGVDIPKWAFVQMLDALVTFRWQNTITDVIGSSRRSFYGKAGAYRDKPYGLEYRTPSNYWLADSNYVLDISNLAWWIINNEAATKGIYDMINFKKIKEYYDDNLSNEAREQIVNRICDIWSDNLKLPEVKNEIVIEAPRIRLGNNPIRNPLHVRYAGLGLGRTPTFQTADMAILQQAAQQAGANAAARSRAWITIDDLNQVQRSDAAQVAPR